ncbi:HET-domain-containing protein [Amniculicola lignicola CBS 123094]|uniref:HET-domain-containing protein n=1 Tax=Amniculicola lignicola CBS 123094 TaxID=1392246 RepID=A0A6A5WP74_9PLEO|nr:HET-domain-containing protein [Amniculicola lignicola CBS 123094]
MLGLFTGHYSTSRARSLSPNPRKAISEERHVATTSPIEKKGENLSRGDGNQIQCHPTERGQGDGWEHRVDERAAPQNRKQFNGQFIRDPLTLASTETQESSMYYSHVNNRPWQTEEEPSQPYNWSQRTLPSDSVPIIRELLEKVHRHPINSEILAAAVSAWNTVHPEKWDALDILILLLRHNHTGQVPAKVLKAAARNNHGHEMLKLLLKWDRNSLVSEEILIASLMGSNGSTMETLLRQGPHLEVTDNVILAAVNNSAVNTRTIIALLHHRKDASIKANIMMAVIKRSSIDVDLLAAISRYRDNIETNEDTIVKAIQHNCHIVEDLLNYNNIEITSAMIRTAVEQTHVDIKVVKILLDRWQGPNIDEAIMESAHTRNTIHPGLLELLRNSGKGTPHNVQTCDRTNVDDKPKSPAWTTAPIHCISCFDLNFPKDFPAGLMIADVIRDAETGCRYCSMICSVIQEMIEDFDPEQTVGFALDPSYEPESSQLLLDVWTGTSNKAIKLEVYRHEKTPIFSPLIGEGRSIQYNASADECIILANQWLDDCNKSHSKCVNGLTTLPTRVIRVGSDTTSPSLHISNSEVGKYIALSHCWGKGVTVTTTTENIDSMTREIPFDVLPKTFQNAITITRKLCIEYLWIDSLCIIQDSAEDWSKEAARMTQVYHNSAVTIAADGLAKPSGGCCAPFDTIPPKRNASVAIRCVNSEGIACTVYVRRRLQKDPGNGVVAHGEIVPPNISTELVRSALNSRGWTLQERLLAPRILHYSPTELAWECATQLCCECSLRPTSGNAFKARFFAGIENETDEKNPNRSSLGQGNTEMIQSQKFAQWAEIVHEFTARKLTYQTDRLPAISGLAGYMQIDESDEYICGLWRANLNRYLLWKVQDDTSKRARSRLHERLSGPSWSWAAVSNRVKFLNYTKDEWKDDVDILDVSYVLTSKNNPFGPVDCGVLTARGLLVPVWATSPGYGDVLDGLPLRFCERSGTGQQPFLELGRLLPDVVDDAGEYPEVDVSERLFLLPLLKATCSMERACIVLRRVIGEDDILVRVGVLGGVYPWHSLGHTNFSAQEVFWGLWDELSKREVIFIR